MPSEKEEDEVNKTAEAVGRSFEGDSPRELRSGGAARARSARKKGRKKVERQSGETNEKEDRQIGAAVFW